MKIKLTEDQIERIEKILNEPVVGSDRNNCVYCNHVHPEEECNCGCTDYD